MGIFTVLKIFYQSDNDNDIYWPSFLSMASLLAVTTIIKCSVNTGMIVLFECPLAAPIAPLRRIDPQGWELNFVPETKLLLIWAIKKKKKKS